MSKKRDFRGLLTKVLCLVFIVPIFAALIGCGGLNIDKLARKLDSDIDELFSQIDNESVNVQDRFYGLEYTSTNDIKLPYRIYIPDSYKNKGDGLPLLVFLHGSGERGNDNEAHILLNTPFFRLINDEEISAEMSCVIVAPQCSAESNWASSIKAVNELTKKIVDNLNIDDTRVYITGVSMGGNGTFAALANKPDLYAGAIPICGWADLGTAEIIKDIPIWAFHAADDYNVSVRYSREIYAEVKAVGGDKFKYTEYTSGGHGIWGTVYSNMDNLRWLFEQVKESK